MRASEPRQVPHALYRFFDAAERLLYVGITMSPGSRWREHSLAKPWWIDVRRVSVEPHLTRESALAAELAAIKGELPLYNIAGSSPRQGSEVENRYGRAARADDATALSLDPHSLIGSFFHSAADPGWQGLIVGEPAPGVYLVQTFSWLPGASGCQRLVPIDEMREWRFYDSEEWMELAFEKSVGRDWEKQQSERECEVV